MPAKATSVAAVTPVTRAPSINIQLTAGQLNLAALHYCMAEGLVPDAFNDTTVVATLSVDPEDLTATLNLCVKP